MGDHKNVPAGTLHCQDRNGPVTVLRDYDTLLLDSWRLSVAEARRLRQVISDALPDMIAAQAEMAGPACEKDGEIIDTYGGEHYWRCGYPGTVRLPSGRLFCEDHAGELGYGPKQEEYGFDPNDGHNPMLTGEA